MRCAINLSQMKRITSRPNSRIPPSLLGIEVIQHLGNHKQPRNEIRIEFTTNEQLVFDISTIARILNSQS